MKNSYLDNKVILKYCPDYYRIINEEFSELDYMTDKIITIFQTYIFKINIKDKNELNEAISFQKSFLSDGMKYNSNTNISRSITNSHIRELIILETLNRTKADYKDLQYRFIDNRHLIEINKANTTYKYCIFNENVTVKNLLNNDSIQYKGFCIEDDFFNNVQKREYLNMNIAV